MFKFTVSFILANGYTHNYGYSTIEEAREMVALSAKVLMPGERIELTQNA